MKEFDRLKNVRIRLCPFDIRGGGLGIFSRKKIASLARKLYSRAMKTQHPNEHQYLNDILNVLSQRISGDFMREKGGDMTQSYDKSPYTHRKIHQAT